MNKRQKKKLFKQTLIKVRKIHPKEGDVICLQPNLEQIDVGIMNDFMNIYMDNKLFGEANLVIVPADIKKISDKEEVQMCVDKLQSVVDQMEK